MDPAAITTQGLTKHYGTFAALADLDLEVAPGEALGFLGPNGSGKTTTIRLLLGLIRPTGGRAEIFGLDARRQAVEAHRRLGYVPGEVSLWPSLTGEETLHLLGEVQGRVDTAYRTELIERFDLDPTRKVRAYSKGNRQKLMLIAALAARPDLLLLDEPTSGLDPLMEQAFRHCVHEARERGQTLFLSSHILSEVEALCDRVAILRQGRLVEIGTLSEMRHLTALSVEATFDGSIPDLSNVAGVSVVGVDGPVVRLHVQGPIEPLLKVLAASGVHELLSHEPSLEELFLAHYGGGDARLREAPVSADPSPELTRTAPWRTRTVVARRAAWSAGRSGLVWGLGFGTYVAVSSLGYASSYSTPAEREQFARLFGANTAVNALVGPARRLDTVAGFTAWRSLGVLGVVGAIWGLLAATRLLRGEEDAGRWELLLSGHASRRGATGQTLVGLASGLVALWATTSAVVAVVGRSASARISPAPPRSWRPPSWRLRPCSWPSVP